MERGAAEIGYNEEDDEFDYDFNPSDHFNSE